MFNKRKKPQGFLKLSKGIANRLHPFLEVLDKTKVPFEGWYHMQEKYFCILYGINMEKGLYSANPACVADTIKEYEGDNYDILRG